MAFKVQKVVMLPTNKAEGALIINGKMQNYRADYLYTQEYLKSCNAKSYHLYILSDDEIKEGDWWYNASTGLIWKVTADNVKCYNQPSNMDRTGLNKIVATTDTNLTIQIGEDNIASSGGFSLKHPVYNQLPQIPESFIKAFIKAYNEGKPITEVNVEYVIWTQDIKTNKFSLFINPFNCINIKTIKDSYSRDEVIRILNKFGSKVYGDYTRNETMEDFTHKWIEQNL